MKTNLWILIIGILLFSSCLDDEGNYSYSELNPTLIPQHFDLTLFISS